MSTKDKISIEAFTACAFAGALLSMLTIFLAIHFIVPSLEWSQATKREWILFCLVPFGIGAYGGLALLYFRVLERCGRWFSLLKEPKP